MARTKHNGPGVQDYPDWIYYPPSSKPAPWVPDFVAAVQAVRSRIDSASVDALNSDLVLSHLRPGLEKLGFQVEISKSKGHRIHRPVLFGPQGRELVSYEVDGVHDRHGIILEVEAGRGARGNAIYRDLIRTSLIVDARYLALGAMRSYRHLTRGKEVSVASFKEAKGTLDAIYASGRLKLPFEGVLLFGY